VFAKSADPDTIEGMQEVLEESIKGKDKKKPETPWKLLRSLRNHILPRILQISAKD
jgi:uncharacterized protein with HEPN domain